jgi:primosomal protein N' (replication factor Y)
LLGTATPSIESYYQAKSGGWGLVTMTKRYLDTALPEIILADTLKEKKQKTIRGDFSFITIQKLQDRLVRKEQSILFQNRRGYAPILSCDECAYVPKCINCSVSLTYHLLKAEISCHYCGHTETIPTKCPVCGSGKIKTVGYGTEKIEDDLKLILPKARIQRMDLDSTRKKDSFKKLIQELEKGNTDILVGTQMVVKGLDFEKVTFVGVFDIDRLIHFPDFRSLEKTFQVLTQVSGRAGRRASKGEVVVQTNNPGLSIFQKVKNNDFNLFYGEEIKEREKFNYPPFVRLIKIICKDPVEKTCLDLADEIAIQLVHSLGKKRVLGPEKPLINRIKNYFIQDIIIKLEKGKLNLPTIKGLIVETSEKALSKKEYKKSIVIFDVDPL